MVYAAGLDFGTSGARLVAIDEAQQTVATTQVAYGQHSANSDWASCWLSALQQVLAALPVAVRSQLAVIAINGTSGTVVLCDELGHSITPPLLYNDDCGHAYGEQLADIAPSGSPVLSATSSLVKLLWWKNTLPPEQQQSVRHLLHQADWLAGQLHGKLGLSDYHNALKLGYDIGSLAYPTWLLTLAETLDIAHWLPQVQAPGSLFGPISDRASDRYDLPRDCMILAGTTDSIAAFLASGARSPGDAVTSLGSTLVIKLLSTTRVDDSRYGIYSHRLGDLWLVGGASNTGGAVLRQFFTDDELQSLSVQVPRDCPSPLDYYPLSRRGERFPISDPTLAPRLTPRPENPVDFLHGLLEGMARIEAQGYERLCALGATAPTQIMTAGGGAQNLTWRAIRDRWLPVPVTIATSTEAAFGTAGLALRGWQSQLSPQL